ncbi:MAG: 4-alpha-glucanotransferase [Tannerellaceae bacterium]|jgi:4-alpha-glucanotransferase|nr:4-alpha-glucanotransferase [Tannerellaceae bacterium]
MKLYFHINFHTTWGQQLHIVGSIPELGNWNTAFAREMEYIGEGNWRFAVDVSPSVQSVEYRYLVKENASIVFEEWEWNHRAFPNGQNEACVYLDCWQERPANSAYYSSAFTNSIFAQCQSADDKNASLNNRKYHGNLTIRIFAPLIEAAHYLALTGNCEVLGNWNPAKALSLTRHSNFPEWSIDLNTEELQWPIEYKFLIADAETQNIISWEQGENRILDLPDEGTKHKMICVSGLFFRDDFSPWRGAGTVIPVFSLRSADSFGAGDLGDLRLFVDWIKKTGQRIIQVLPMNDTTTSNTWRDSYPYSAISIYALHPIYICLHRMGTMKDEKQRIFFEEKRQALNALDEMDYEAVIRWKTEYCRSFFQQEGKQWLEKESFHSFLDENGEWLKPYAAYSWLRDKYQTADASCWENFAVYDKVKIRNLCHSEWEAISFYCFLQFVLHIQFKEASDYARSNGIVLKGDLPIGVNRNSVEAWMEPQLFNMHGQAGAPPDDFSVTGQNWSFPTYNWEMMEKDGFAWWRNRFAKLSDYFDSFRIDHILGFFRIWEIPRDYTQGLCGHFNPALPMTQAEIEQYGLPFNETRFTTPHIHGQHLQELFGNMADEVCDTYLAQSSSHHYVLKPFCNTQAKIEALFSDKAESHDIKNGLLSIANEILFVRDPYGKNLFHPRIAAERSCIYAELSASDRHAFDRLYHDYYYRRHNEYWKETACKRLTPLTRSTRMLTCGEDLGMIPDSVPEVMKRLQILSLEIERAPKSLDSEFAILSQLPYLSVCTTSTHDMPPLRNWWNEENRNKIQRYYNNVLGQDGEAPAECPPNIVSMIIERHLQAPSMLTIIPLQDWLGTDNELRRKNHAAERINIPANPAHYWRYRMHLNIEDLLTAAHLNERIKKMIKKSERR